MPLPLLCRWWYWGERERGRRRWHWKLEREWSKTIMRKTVVDVPFFKAFKWNICHVLLEEVGDFKMEVSHSYYRLTVSPLSLSLLFFLFFFFSKLRVLIGTFTWVLFFHSHVASRIKRPELLEGSSNRVRRHTGEEHCKCEFLLEH